jgi:hypothetical protein
MSGTPSRCRRVVVEGEGDVADAVGSEWFEEAWACGGSSKCRSVLDAVVSALETVANTLDYDTEATRRTFRTQPWHEHVTRAEPRRGIDR